MKIFADTASLTDLKEFLSWGMVQGCTTNPMIMAKEGAEFEPRIKEILKLVPGPVSIEVTSNDFDEMVKEGKQFNQWGKNVVTKLPMTVNGLKALQVLKQDNIKTNLTACMTVSQAFMAAKAGATYVSLFYSRIGDLGHHPEDVVSQTAVLFEKHNIESEIIVGSIRHVIQITEAFLAGADIVTVPSKFFPMLISNPQTDKTIEEFLHFWKEYKQK